MDYKSGSVFKSKATELGTQRQQTEQPKTESTKGIIEFATLYVSNDSATHDAETAKLIERVEQIRHGLTNDRLYKERLDNWRTAELLDCTRIWFGDTSQIIRANGQYGYVGHQPQPDWIATINPTNYSEIIDFNISNIQSYIKHIGTFEDYRLQYIKNMNSHADSVLYERKLIMDLNTAEDTISGYERMGFYGVSTRDWYDSFTNKNDILNKKDYEIWDLNQPLSELPIFSTNQRPTSPYLFHLLDNPKDVVKAANGYLFHLKIPFLRKLREECLKKALAANNDSISPYSQNDNIAFTDTIMSESVESDTEKQTKDDVSIRSKKKAKQFTTKQQMILLNALGFLDASIIRHLSNTHKAAILAQLLRRSEQETRSMLTYWKGVRTPKDYDCSHPNDVEKVINFLSDNNLQI